MKNTKTNSAPKLHWFTTVLAGMALVASGVAIAFFPKMAMSIALIVSSILFFAFGVTDSISALRFKNTESDWKANLGNGLISLVVGIFIFTTMYVPTITPMMVLIVLCIWAVIRCVLLVVGFFTGKTKKKANLLQALFMGAAGVAAFLFRDLILASTKIVGYALIGIGALVLIYAFMKKSALKNKELEQNQTQQPIPEKSNKQIEENEQSAVPETKTNAQTSNEENDADFAEVTSVEEM